MKKTIVKYYVNKINRNKYLEIHNDGYGHKTVKQFMNWNRTRVTNYTGDGNFHRWRKYNLDVLLEDYVETNRYLLCADFNTKQYWVYDEFENVYIDIPAEVLDKLEWNDVKKSEEIIFEMLKYKPKWLFEKDYWYDDIEI